MCTPLSEHKKWKLNQGRRGTHEIIQPGTMLSFTPSKYVGSYNQNIGIKEVILL